MALGAALLGFFVITLDALVVNAALPSIRNSLGGGITGLQWVIDGYTLMFAALLLSAGSLTDRLGARRTFAVGLAVFVAASAVCGLAPNLGMLVSARLVQGAGAAVIVPSSLALIREAFPDAGERAKAISFVLRPDGTGPMPGRAPTVQYEAEPPRNAPSPPRTAESSRAGAPSMRAAVMYGPCVQQ
ncbi:MFS transporter [Streptomyces sp. NPDC056653]|uniref:MFS transporter n=1 Tax=Streptomyces sp. NPDC056653 TaxID=3345894 RepID=UPI0036D03DDA